jgi:hypothetical protein
MAQHSGNMCDLPQSVLDKSCEVKNDHPELADWASVSSQMHESCERSYDELRRRCAMRRRSPVPSPFTPALDVTQQDTWSDGIPFHAGKNGNTGMPIQMGKVQGGIEGELAEVPIYLEPRALASYRRFLYFARQTGYRPPLLSLSSGYRSYEEQADIRRRHGHDGGGQVGAPGYSRHQKGIAADVYYGIDQYNVGQPDEEPYEHFTNRIRATPAWIWMSSVAPSYGWTNTGETWRTGREPWHWEYDPSKDQHINDRTPQEVDRPY